MVAIGETGLDYYRLTGDLGWQRERFRVHIRAARRAGRPLVVHTRAAAADTLAIMREESARDAGGVMHCFTETWEVARAALDLGFHISFSGIVTFKNAHELKDVARRVPLDRLLIETDSPVPRAGAVPRASATSRPTCRTSRPRSRACADVPLEEIARATTRQFLPAVRDRRRGGACHAH